MKTLLLENVNPAAAQMLADFGAKVETIGSAIDEAQLLQKLENVQILGVRSRTWLRKDLLEKAKDLKVIGAFIVGVNKIDLQAAGELGIPVFHGPFASTRSVAELAMGFVFQLFRKVGEKNLGAHSSQWLKKVDGREIRGKTLGIVGFSNIGSQLGQMAEALGMRVIFHEVANVLPRGLAQRVDFDFLLENSDAVSIHVPSLPATRNLFSRETIGKMKKGAFLINTARGDVWNEADVCEALQSGQLGGVATDVFPTEPKSPQESLHSPLTEFSNAILTPHIGGSTFEAQVGIAKEVAGKVLHFLRTGDFRDAINAGFLKKENLRT